MVPTAFDYQRASSVGEAVTLLAESGGNAKILAGGHSLIPTLKLRLARPATLIDIGRVDELKGISEDGDTIVIGALATHDEVATSDVVQAKAPNVAAAAAAIGDLQVRNCGTIGGALVHADPASDYPAAILTDEAEMVVQGPGGSRTVSAADFFVDIFATAVQEDELLTAVRVSARAAGTGSAYLKFPNPASGYAVVGCAANVTMDGGKCASAKVAFNGVANVAFRDAGVEDAITGTGADAAAIAAAAECAGNGQECMSDTFASAEFRAHLAKVYAGRALAAAVADAS
ncbi:MAG: xanthine dehydrogenase family protein subunit M [Lentisphaeria bacterium]|jgi:carbon-monoxide dehydrogenase medium subunit|nr:xanthine dehydrogenase family protein subunit M [Lentisphaeria bacterium]